MDFTHVAGVNEDRHSKLGGFMEELEERHDKLQGWDLISLSSSYCWMLCCWGV